MMAVRPRTITDDRLLQAARTVIGRLGPDFTLADVGEQAGVAAGTLVHRFGSKHGLLAAMISSATDALRDAMRAAAGGADDPLTMIRQALVERYAALDDPATATNNLAQLAFDLADDELRAGMARFYAVMDDELTPLLVRATNAGDLPGAPPAPVAARILAALVDGTAVHWSARPEGGLSERLDGDLEAVLAGWQRDPENDERSIG